MAFGCPARTELPWPIHVKPTREPACSAQHPCCRMPELFLTVGTLLVQVDTHANTAQGSCATDTASRHAPSKRAKHPELFPFLHSHLEELLLFAASDTVTQSRQQIKYWLISSHSRALGCIQTFSDPNLPFQTLRHPLLKSCTESGSSVGSMWKQKALCRNTQVQTQKVG